MRILISDFAGLAELFYHLGLKSHSLSVKGNYFYFQFNDLSKKDQFNWQEIDEDTQDALKNMGMLFSENGVPLGETEETRQLSKELRANQLREYAKLKSDIWKSKSTSLPSTKTTASKSTKKETTPGSTEKFRIYLTAGNAKKNNSSTPLSDPRFLQVPTPKKGQQFYSKETLKMLEQRSKVMNKQASTNSSSKPIKQTPPPSLITTTHEKSIKPLDNIPSPSTPKGPSTPRRAG